MDSTILPSTFHTTVIQQPELSYLFTFASLKATHTIGSL